MMLEAEVSAGKHQGSFDAILQDASARDAKNASEIRALVSV